MPKRRPSNSESMSVVSSIMAAEKALDAALFLLGDEIEVSTPLKHSLTSAQEDLSQCVRLIRIEYKPEFDVGRGIV